MRSGPGLLVAFLAMTIAHHAFASPSARLVYSRAQDAASCPDESALRKAVAARVGYDPFFPWAKQTVVVEIETRRGTFSARVKMIDEQGLALGTRELTSSRSDCAELFDATALAISIALDAAAAAQQPAPAASSPSREAAPAPAAPTSPAPEPSMEPQAPRDRVEVTSPPTEHRSYFFAGIDASSSVGTAPSTAVGGALFLGARVRFVSAALELHLDAPASADIQGGSVSSWLYAGSVVPCAHYGVLSACVVGMLGSLQGSGDARESLSRSALFAAVGGRIGAEWGLTEALSLRVHGDLLRDLAPTALSIDDHAWTAPSLVASAAVGLVVRFP